MVGQGRSMVGWGNGRIWQGWDRAMVVLGNYRT